MSQNPHIISQQEATIMIERFAENKKAILDGDFKGQDILPDCESFNREAVEALLASVPNYAGLRIYLGMDDHNNVRFVLKLKDDHEADVNEVILERGQTP